MINVLYDINDEIILSTFWITKCVYCVKYVRHWPLSDWSWYPLCISRTQAKNAGSNLVPCNSSDNAIDVLTNTFEMKYHLFSESRFCGHSVHFSDWS
jgi:hypothetical protein